MSEQRLISGGQGRSSGDVLGTAAALALAAWLLICMGILLALIYAGAWLSLVAIATAAAVSYRVGRNDGRDDQRRDRGVSHLDTRA